MQARPMHQGPPLTAGGRCRAAKLSREPRAAATAAKDRMGSLEEEEEGLDDSSSVVPTSESKSSGTCTHTHTRTHTHTHTLAFSGSEEEDGSESEDSEVQAEEVEEAKGKKGKGSKPVEMVPATQYLSRLKVVVLIANYYNLETCYDKMNNMRKEVKKVCEDLKDTRPHASGRAYTPEVCFYSLYALLGGSV